MAIYRLGLEDPGIWSVIDDEDAPAASLSRIAPGNEIGHVGNGDFLWPGESFKEGVRSIREVSGGVWEGTYSSFPAPAFLTHTGDHSSDLVSLTFDDGPDPDHTPKVLDILKAAEVKASFFVLGNKALKHSDLIRRIVQEGHEIGNHTYWHPNLSVTPEDWIVLELNATRHIIEAAAHRSTTLFRPPFNADRFPANQDELFVINTARRLGYVTVNASIDSEDWHARTAEEILSRIKAHRSEGNVILLHDGGGDRSATIEALPKIIGWLRKRDDRIVPLSVLSGISPNVLMPAAVPTATLGSRFFVNAGLLAIEALEQSVWFFMTAVGLLLMLRTLLIIVLAYARRGQERLSEDPVHLPPVSVLIAAYNEEQVISPTLRSVLESDYPAEIEVIVVDDGSTDDTCKNVEAVRAHHGQVRLIRQPNLGKAKALNRAISHARFDHIVTLDADTHLDRAAIRRLVQPLTDPKVGAVSGHAKVGNMKASWLARLQSLEYMAGFNLDRRAYDAWNCITVVPGAVSSFRKQALLAAHGIPGDTMAEDTDVTLQLHRLGYKIAYAPGAIAWTEAPETIEGFKRQRVRWAFGTLQCLWKHRAMLFDPRYKALAFFSLPSIWFCHILLVTLVPLVDLSFLGFLLLKPNWALAIYALFFLASDWLLALAACRLGQEPFRITLLVIPARLIYRPLLSWIVWISVIRALKGVWKGWGKIERRGLELQALGSGYESM